MAIKFGRPLERSIGFVPVTHSEGEAHGPLDLTVRMRRNRRADWARRMVRENVLTTDDLIWPVFVMDGQKARQPVASMPGVERLSVDEIGREAARAAKLSIPCIALFPYTNPSLRDETGSEALNPDNLVCRAMRAIKKEARTSASCATSRSTRSPATAMTASSATARSSTTRRSRCW